MFIQSYMEFHILICKVKKLLQWKPELTKYTIQPYYL